MLLIVSAICLLCDTVIWARFFRKKRSPERWKRAAFTTQILLLDIALPVTLMAARSWMGDDQRVQATLWLMWFWVISFLPKLIFTVFLLLNTLVNKIFRKRWRFLDLVGGSVAGLVIVIMIQGASAGVSRLKVNHIEIASAKIPAAFDGYRIAHFSDLHAGNIPLRSSLIPNLIDSINGLNPDLIVQSGDIVNLRSSEITPAVYAHLARLKAPDGIAAVLGNHDRGTYIRDGGTAGRASLARLKSIQKDSLGWNLLLNEHRWIKRGTDSIAVAGVEYPARGRHAGSGTGGGGSDLRRAMRGIDTDSVFSILISHTPSLWDSIPAVATPDLTVSGHVHAMQVKFEMGDFRFSPARWVYPEWSGLYARDGRRLYVNDGIGYVFFPMRLGAPAEITVYTLRSSGR